MSTRNWIVVTLAAALLITASLYFAFASSSFADAAGWVQVVVAAFSIPILYYELNRIRQAIEQRPVISVGVCSVSDLPLSKIRQLPTLSPKATVSHGYPSFWLAVRNTGKVTARHMKIHLEYQPPKERKSILIPVIEVSEFRDDQRFSFKKVNNADFVFIAGSDWLLHSNDTEMFGFYMTTVLVKKKTESGGEIRERPDPGEYDFDCTVWAEGLNKPLNKHITVIIQLE